MKQLRILQDKGMLLRQALAGWLIVSAGTLVFAAIALAVVTVTANIELAVLLSALVTLPIVATVFVVLVRSDYTVGERLWRLADLAIGASTFAVIAPLFLVIAIAIKVDTPGPAVFKKRATGRGGESTYYYMFRTMRIDFTPEDLELIQSLQEELNDPEKVAGDGQPLHRMRTAKIGRNQGYHDPRVTRVGYFLRRTGLDVLPLLVNLLRGDLSLFAVRPSLRRNRDGSVGENRPVSLGEGLRQYREQLSIAYSAG